MTIEYSYDAMPASIVTAILKVQGQLGAMKKENRNQFGKYDYVSADDLYAALIHKLADAGLVISPVERDEVQIVKYEGDDYALFKYGFILSTATDTFDHPDFNRSMFIKVNGPQTFGAAESYLQKTFLRGLFKIPTGDHDLDEVAPSKPKGQPAKKAKKAEMPAPASMEIVDAARDFLEGIKERPISANQKQTYVENFGSLASQMRKEDAEQLRDMLKEATRDANS